DLNGAQCPAVYIAAVDIVRVNLLYEMAFLVPADGNKDNHHVLQGRWYRVLQDISQHIAPIAQAHVVECGAHDRRVAAMQNGEVIESTDPPFEGVAKGPDAARSVERLVRNAIDRKFLALLQRRHLAAHAIHDRFASLAVFVDDAIRAPGQVVVDGVGGILRKRPNPQSDSVEHLEALRHVEGHDGHEAWSEAALRDERSASIGGELPYTACAHHILRQVKIMGTGR